MEDGDERMRRLRSRLRFRTIAIAVGYALA